MDETHIGYESILRRLRQLSPHPRLRAVHLCQKGAWLASGTLILDAHGKHTGVVTASHPFALGGSEGYVFYRELQPSSSVEHPINSVTQPIREDVALCIPGMALPIKNFSRHHGGRWERPKDFQGYRERLPDCISIATSEVVPVLGYIHEPPDKYYYVLQYHSYPGESGAGFVKADDELYVLASGIDVDDKLRTFFGIPPEMVRVTLAAAIRIS